MIRKLGRWGFAAFFSTIIALVAVEASEAAAMHDTGTRMATQMTTTDKGSDLLFRQ